MLLFEIRDTKKIDIFTTIFSNMKEFTETMNISMNSEKMIIQGMDKSHVLLHDLEFAKEWFDEYGVDGDTLDFGLNSETVNKILNFRAKDQLIRVLCKSVDSENINFEFLNTDDNSKEFNKYLETGKIVIEFDLMNIPPVDYNSTITIGIKRFKALMNDLAKMGKKISFKCIEDKCSISTTSVNIDIEKKNVIDYKLDGEPIDLSFSLELLQTICKVEKLCNEVQVKLSEVAPILVQYNIGDEDDETREQLKIHFHLAPFEEDDEENE